MKAVIEGAKVWRGGDFSKAPLFIDGDRVVSAAPKGAVVFDFSHKYVFPGFTDVHVHLREPGFSYKETMETGTLAAARGGYTAVCAMPNLIPVPDSLENLEPELERIRRGARIQVLPYGSITAGELGREISDMEALAPRVCGFSDDGRGVESEGLMRSAMVKAAALGRPIAAHCEDMSAPPEEREPREAERNIRLAAQTGCALHLCHVSKKETVELVRDAKARGVNLSCETAPHYLLLSRADVRDEGRFKMNPPIGDEADRAALLAGIQDGTVDMIATDHAPHSQAEKSGGFEGSLAGVVGLDCAFPALYTALVETGKISLSRLIELLSAAPARRFGLGCGGPDPGSQASLTVFDLDKEFVIDPGAFASMGKSSPFAGARVRGKCLMTLYKGEIVWEDKQYA